MKIKSLRLKMAFLGKTTEYCHIDGNKIIFDNLGMLTNSDTSKLLLPSVKVTDHFDRLLSRLCLFSFKQETKNYSKFSNLDKLMAKFLSINQSVLDNEKHIPNWTRSKGC